MPRKRADRFVQILRRDRRAEFFSTPFADTPLLGEDESDVFPSHRCPPTAVGLGTPSSHLTRVWRVDVDHLRDSSDSQARVRYTSPWEMVSMVSTKDG